MPSRRVSIIIPVYGDWSSLEECIKSLKKYVDTERHKVMFVNDCGPEVETMEQNIKKAIKGTPNFKYHRNPKNLGFVKTCNRAVLELDKSGNDILLLNSDTIITKGALEEMLEVLYLDDKHGTVSPRSNSASNTSIPMRSRSGDPYSMDYSYGIYKKIKDELPRYYVAPDSHGFCLLIKRSVIEEFGLFDEIYGRGNGEETDFCLRIRKQGFKSLIANRAFVYHFHSRSFTAEEKDALRAKNMAITKSRYPQLDTLLFDYLNHTIDPVDWFADVLAGPSKPAKFMVDLSHMPQTRDDNTNKVLGFLRYLSARKNKTEYTIVTNPDVDEFFNFSQYGLRVLHMGTTEELFHVGYCPFQVMYPNDLTALNKMCLRIVFAVPDLPQPASNRPVVADALLFADNIVVKNTAGRDSLLAGFAATISNAKFVTIDLSQKNAYPAVVDLLSRCAERPVNVAGLRRRWQHIIKASETVYIMAESKGPPKRKVRRMAGKLRRLVKERRKTS